MDNQDSDITESPDESSRYNRTILTILNDAMFRRLAPAIAVLVAVMAVGVAGNVVICYIFTRKLRKSTQNFLLLCLGVFDLLSSCIGIPSEIFDMRNYYYYESAEVCKAMRFLTTFPSLASILVLLVIAADRYRKVCKPLNKQIRLLHARIVLVVIVVIALVFSVPAVYIYGHRTFPSPVLGVYGYDCSIDDTFKDRPYPLIYEVVFFACFVLCTIALVSIYIRIWLETRRHREYMKTHATFGRALLDDTTTTSSFNYDSSNDDATTDGPQLPGSRVSSVNSSGRKRASKDSHRKRRRSKTKSDRDKNASGNPTTDKIYKRVSVIPENKDEQFSDSCDWMIGNGTDEEEVYKLKEINKTNTTSSNRDSSCNNNNMDNYNSTNDKNRFSNTEYEKQEAVDNPCSKHENDTPNTCSSADTKDNVSSFVQATAHPTEHEHGAKEAQDKSSDKNNHLNSQVQRNYKISQCDAASQMRRTNDSQLALMLHTEDEIDSHRNQSEYSKSTNQSHDVHEKESMLEQSSTGRKSENESMSPDLANDQSKQLQLCDIGSSDSHSHHLQENVCSTGSQNPGCEEKHRMSDPEGRHVFSSQNKEDNSGILKPPNSHGQNDVQFNQSQPFLHDTNQSNRISFFIRSDDGFDSNGSTEGLQSQRFSSSNFLRGNAPIRPLVHSKSSQSLTAKRVRKALRATRTTIIAFAITAGFILSYLPHLILIILRSVKTDFEHDLEDIPLIFYNIFIRSYFANNVLNVFVYGAMNLEFRTQIVNMGTRIRSPFSRR